MSEASQIERMSQRAERVRTLLDAFHEVGRRNCHMGYTPEDVQRLILEVREEMLSERPERI